MGNQLSTPDAAKKAGINKSGYLALLLVSAQFGIQPFLNERFLSRKSVNSCVVLLQESIKLALCISLLAVTKQLPSEMSKWKFRSSILLAFVPAAIYNAQNVLSVFAYRNVDPLTFNLMNQTKIIWTALFLNFILKKTPSRREVISLSFLMLVAVMLSLESRKKEEQENRRQNVREQTTSSKPAKTPKHRTEGLIALVVATICSGLAGGLTQRALQNKQRNALVFSAELALYGNVFGLCKLYVERIVNVMDGKRVNEHGWTYELCDSSENCKSLIPIFCNVVGGVGVGMITKHTSAIHKSYALIAGIFITLLIRQFAYKQDALSSTMFIAVPITMASLWLKIS